MPTTPPNDPWLAEAIPVPRKFPAIPIRTYRITGTNTREELHHLQCLRITHRLGTDPGQALFRYKWGIPDTDIPPTSEAALDVGSSYPKTIEIDDRLQVWATRPDGQEEPIFDGRALTFTLSMSGESDNVTIHAVGIARACWDSTVPGQKIRQAGNPTTGTSKWTDIPVRFNADGEPNATPDEHDEDMGGGQMSPIFLDPRVILATDERTHWTLPKAAAFLIFAGNPNQTVVKNPSRSTLNSLYVNRRPIDGTPYDPNNAATYTSHDIIVNDAPRTGRDWPTELATMTRDFGFGMFWKLERDDTDPDHPAAKTSLHPFHAQGGDVKDVWLQARGESLDPNLSNVGEIDVTRTLVDVVNSWTVQGGLKQYEISVILAPVFASDPSDCASASAIARFDKSAASFEDVRYYYRDYIADECGEGHYPPGSTIISTTALNLDDALGAGHYAQRRRPGRHQLISTSTDDKPLPPQLSISTDYAGTKPGLWDGTGTWQPVQSGWKLMKDELGIQITCANPNDWKIGDSTVTGHPYPRGVVNAVEAQAATGGTRFFLRLTCVIEGDEVVGYTAPRIGTSPLASTIKRIIDARDRLKYQAITKKSQYNNTATAVIQNDDTDTAQAEAETYRAASEAGILEGTITIKRFTRYYELSDRIREINGRGLNFRTDTGGEGRTPIYPMITGITWNLADGQTTTLEISDEATQRHQISRKISRDAPRPGRYDR